jgi:hypothetical protein
MLTADIPYQVPDAQYRVLGTTAAHLGGLDLDADHDEGSCTDRQGNGKLRTTCSSPR